MKISTVIKRAQARLSHPKRWTKGTMARTASGEECDELDPRARSFCVAGMLNKVGGGRVKTAEECKQIRDLIMGAIPDSFGKRKRTLVGKYNDTRTHRQMLLWLDRAIKAALKMEASK